jgi:hypothetical protein
VARFADRDHRCPTCGVPAHGASLSLSLEQRVALKAHRARLHRAADTSRYGRSFLALASVFLGCVITSIIGGVAVSLPVLSVAALGGFCFTAALAANTQEAQDIHALEREFEGISDSIEQTHISAAYFARQGGGL